MTTLRDIVNDALREGNIVSVGSDPEAEEFDEGLTKLQTLIKTTYGAVAGEVLRSVSYGKEGLTNVYAKEEDQSDYISTTYVPSNIRLVLNLSAATTLYLPPNPRDGARFAVVDNAGNLATNALTVNGNGRNIESAASVVLNENDLRREWFYRADLADWVRVTDPTADDEMPFPQEFDEYFMTHLARRLNPRYGIETRPETVMTLQEVKTMFRARYRQKTEVPLELGLIRLSSNTDDYDGTTEHRFNHGLL